MFAWHLPATVFLRLHFPGFFWQSPSIKGKFLLPSLLERKYSAARGRWKSFPMDADADVRSEIKVEKERRGKKRKRVRDICRKTRKEADRARSYSLKSPFAVLPSVSSLLTGHPIRRSWLSFLVETKMRPLKASSRTVRGNRCDRRREKQVTLRYFPMLQSR